jgi:excinuclease UvrABC nuclease subunit
VQLEGFSDVSDVLCAGVYALVKRGTVIYVGKSKSLYQRIYAHRHTAKRASAGKSIPSWLPIRGFVFDQVFVRTCRLEDLDVLEAQMVEKYKPRYNESLKSHIKVTAPITLTIGAAIIAMNTKPTESPVRRI